MKTDQIRTLRDVKEVCRKYGYVCKTSPDKELEVYPKGYRDTASYFTDDRYDAIVTVRTSAVAAYKEMMRPLVRTEVLDSLVLWFERHGVDWKSMLHHAWYTGSYGYSFSGSNAAGILQKFRNTDGYEVLDKVPTQPKQHNEDK